jgi:hypothetical protein
MKTLISVAALLASVHAFAMPSVGDDALYDVTTTTTGQIDKGTLEFQLILFNATTHQFLERQILTGNGQTSTQEQMVDESTLASDTAIGFILSNCTMANGTLETITVPAGTFNTCAMQSNSDAQTGTLWLTNVAFGFAKEEITFQNGTKMTLELRSQKLGQ